MKIHISAVLIVTFTALLSGCDGGGGGLPLNDDPSGTTGGSGGSNDGSGNGGPSGNCTYVLDSDITTPTRLVNTSAYCDYELDGWVDVNSALVIEPGVVVQARADSRFLIDGGQIEAVGTAQNPILFEGLSHVSGFWGGFAFREGRESAFDYVDIKDAGQVCSVSYCDDGGFIVDDVSLAFTNSSISNSYVHGMIINRDTNFTAFSNNRFYDNVWAGVAISPELVPMLDSASDYRGVGAENGRPFVQVSSGDQETGEVFSWKALNAPYYVAGYFDVEGGTWVIEPGTEIVMGSEAWLSVSDNGVIQSRGTAAAPILIRGLVQQPGYWDGLDLNNSFWDSNSMTYTTISHSGNLENLTPAYGALSLSESKIYLANNVFRDNAEYGIYCSSTEYNDPSVIVDGFGNGFANNVGGHVSGNCTVE